MHERLVGQLRAAYGSPEAAPDGIAPLLEVLERAYREEATRLAEGASSQASDARREALILDTLQDAVIVTDLGGVVTSGNASARALLSHLTDDLGGTPLSRLFGFDEAGIPLADSLARVRGQGAWNGEVPFVRKGGRPGVCQVAMALIRDRDGSENGFLVVCRDITGEREMERQLFQAQKLEAIGSLAAGIAHEINTPSQYVSDNVQFLADAFQDVFRVFDAYRATVDAIGPDSPLAPAAATVKETAAAVDIVYLAEEVPKAIQQSLDGMNRIAEIVRGMKLFGHPGGGDRVLVDLHDQIKAAITVTRNEWKYVSDIETDFDPDAGSVPCFPGEINHVFLNIIVNAAHAIADAKNAGRYEKGRIRISTRRDGDWAEIRIADDANGIPVEVRPRIFDPFFTTKAVGKGTGQGLAISHRVVVDRHEGTLAFESELGVGTTFIIRLPMGESVSLQEAA